MRRDRKQISGCLRLMGAGNEEFLLNECSVATQGDKNFLDLESGDVALHCGGT